MRDERMQAVHELVVEWMRRARSDLVITRMTDEEEIAPEILAFHAQQAVEKALKALLVQDQVEFPHTHVIGVLLTLCKENGYPVSEDLEEAVALTRYAVAARYPGEAEPVSREDAWRASEMANRVILWVEGQIQKPE